MRGSLIGVLVVEEDGGKPEMEKDDADNADNRTQWTGTYHRNTAGIVKNAIPLIVALVGVGFRLKPGQSGSEGVEFRVHGTKIGHGRCRPELSPRRAGAVHSHLHIGGCERQQLLISNTLAVKDRW